MCRESGDQLTWIKPAEPSSILHFQSGFSMEKTCTKLRLFKLHSTNSESFDHFKMKTKNERTSNHTNVVKFYLNKIDRVQTSKYIHNFQAVHVSHNQSKLNNACLGQRN